MITCIKNGFVVDPKNRVSSKQDLYLIDDVILGPTLEGTKYQDEDISFTIDAEGLIVSPGFIDIHMHEDPVNNEGKIDDSIFNKMLKMGVTTAIGGNCGINTYDPSSYLDIVEHNGAPINVGLFAGHTFAREAVGIKDKYRSISDQEILEINRLLKKSLNHGCYGISYGIRYVPGLNYNELHKTAELCCMDKDVISAHVRSDAAEIYDSIREFVDIGKKLNLSVQVSHIGSMGGFGQMEHVLEMVDAYTLEGVDISCDCYPYYAFSTRIGETTYDEGFLERYSTDYSCIEISEGKYKGMRCTKEIFEELRQKFPETITVCHVMEKRDVDMAIMHPNVMVASDGLVDGESGHPRAANTFPKYIKEFIKFNKLNLVEGLKKITSDPAEKLGINDRGSLSKGSKADITIFSIERICDKGTFENPMTPPEGIEYVFVNGCLVYESGKILSTKKGKALRKERRF